MSDAVTFSGNVAHQPGEAGQAHPAEKQPEGEKPLTRAELMDALSAWNRQQQGLRAKQEKRIIERVEQQLAVLRTAGVEVTEAVRENLARTVREQEASDGEDLPGTPTESKSKPQASQPSGLIAKINAKRDAIAEKYGVSVEEADPEAQNVITDGDPLTFLETYEAACKAKSDRMKQSPEARVPAIVGGGSVSSGATLEESYRAEMKNNRGKPEALRQVQQKYQKLGLDTGAVRLFS